MSKPRRGVRNARVSYAPSGLLYVWLRVTHGLRRGLHSIAPFRGSGLGLRRLRFFAFEVSFDEKLGQLRVDFPGDLFDDSFGNLFDGAARDRTDFRTSRRRGRLGSRP